LTDESASALALRGLGRSFFDVEILWYPALTGGLRRALFTSVRASTALFGWPSGWASVHAATRRFGGVKPSGRFADLLDR
jgi:hypothetical protein